ncbi:hypothetical protein B0H67DRAFT_658127 [Lasiosphaeris hirsuta]|uniref:NmrA-like domain-containing protein n=1 Tax=Lasiosphaeris hirsuta TaxID=260670 RepID=A0AA40E2X3_9PEZI|nr:hypothetical protein B0H67DRAFT_658127 [Lasiosphaeris hirsuta]
MVKIAIAGGSSQVAHEVIDALVARGGHDITLLFRKDPDPKDTVEGTSWAKANYSDKEALTEFLKGFHTVLSFIDPRRDVSGEVQKNLIDASITAGVKRFAPAEWGAAVTTSSAADGKDVIREYLREVNKDKKVLEYCLFQCGGFMNYLSSPYIGAKHIAQVNTWYDFENCRALVIEGLEDKAQMTFTKVEDLARIVARAVEYEGEWPTLGGVNGGTLSSAQIIALGEKIRGKPFQVERLKTEDLEMGQLISTWIPLFHHPAIPEDQVEAISRHFLIAAFLAKLSGGHVVSDEWNKLLPDYVFTSMEQFLTDVWTGKP